MLLLFDSIGRFESPRLIDITYPTIMQWYKILARILLLFSVLDFALAAPVVVQEHEVVDLAKDGLANAADRINVPRTLNSGHWREHEPRQHNPRPRTGSDDSPEPSSPENSLSFNSWMPDPHSPSGSSDSWGSGGSGWESLSSSDPGLPDSRIPGELSTFEFHPPSTEQPEIGPPPAPPSEPELSTKSQPPIAQPSNEESVARISTAIPSDEENAARILMDMSRQGFKPRTYGSGAVVAATA